MIKFFMESPLVSIITVNYNQAQITEALIKSLGKIDYPSIEVIVVDNGSKSSELKSIVARYPEVNFIFSEENVG
ncbi:MAG: glycosyltransferase, partial [Bacteroidota bacterium]